MAISANDEGVNAETLETDNHRSLARRQEAAAQSGFVIVWAEGNLELVGAWLPIHTREPLVLGRAAAMEEEADDPRTRLVAFRQRPGKNERGPVLADPFLSRDQLRVTLRKDGILVENIGKRALLDPTGKAVRELIAAPGDLIEVRGRLLLLASSRPAMLPAFPNLVEEHHPFGRADAHGLVGESETAWRLRDSASFVASRKAHVLLLGGSGTGKEIVARTIHELSATAGRRLVSRNAATLPAGLIDAELFGHVANYPNVGMPERPGLIGEADGGALFLDEIGELSHELSSKLLRVLDEDGDYQRLGDTRTRTSRFRLIGATNRPITCLKADVAARFRLRISLPSLMKRPEDIPLLARHLLRRAAIQDSRLGERFFEGWDGKHGEPRLAIELVKALVSHDYTTHIRELDALLWASLASSTGNIAELTPEVSAALAADEAPPSQLRRLDIRTLTAHDVRSALERSGGVPDKAWRDLGLANRHVLTRLVRKFGLRA